MTDKIKPQKSVKTTVSFSFFTKARKMTVVLIVILVFVLITLPLFTTFNDLLTRAAESSGAYTFLSKNVVPVETRAVSLMLRSLGIKSRPTATYLYISNSGAEETAVFFSWNCVGWQSAVLLIFTLCFGLVGKYKWITKLETVILGITGTFLINLIRICAVIAAGYFYGHVFSTIVHNYAGTLLTMFWFFFYWWFSYKYILEEKKAL